MVLVIEQPDTFTNQNEKLAQARYLSPTYIEVNDTFEISGPLDPTHRESTVNNVFEILAEAIRVIRLGVDANSNAVGAVIDADQVVVNYDNETEFQSWLGAELVVNQLTNTCYDPRYTSTTNRYSAVYDFGDLRWNCPYTDRQNESVVGGYVMSIAPNTAPQAFEAHTPISELSFPTLTVAGGGPWDNYPVIATAPKNGTSSYVVVAIKRGDLDGDSPGSAHITIGSNPLTIWLRVLVTDGTSILNTPEGAAEGSVSMISNIGNPLRPQVHMTYSNFPDSNYGLLLQDENSGTGESTRDMNFWAVLPIWRMSDGGRFEEHAGEPTGANTSPYDNAMHQAVTLSAAEVGFTSVAVQSTVSQVIQSIAAAAIPAAAVTEGLSLIPAAIGLAAGSAAGFGAQHLVDSLLCARAVIDANYPLGSGFRAGLNELAGSLPFINSFLPHAEVVCVHEE
jgi:hypothetical protein